MALERNLLLRSCVLFVISNLYLVSDLIQEFEMFAASGMAAEFNLFLVSGMEPGFALFAVS